MVSRRLMMSLPPSRAPVCFHGNACLPTCTPCSRSPTASRETHKADILLLLRILCLSCMHIHLPVNTSACISTRHIIQSSPPLSRPHPSTKRSPAMEALLSLSFDNIASKDTQKIRKGLRQIEGMLAQICLSSGKSKPSTPSHRRNASAINLGEQQPQSPKKLGALAEDPAFREFFRLQEGFAWNGKSAGTSTAETGS